METTETTDRGRGHQCCVMIRGIPKEGWKPVVGRHYTTPPRQVMIRGIPKEGWKLSGRLSHSGKQFLVMIRGIPKEGWKRVNVGIGVGVNVG